MCERQKFVDEWPSGGRASEVATRSKGRKRDKDGNTNVVEQHSVDGGVTAIVTRTHDQVRNVLREARKYKGAVTAVVRTGRKELCLVDSVKL